VYELSPLQQGIYYHWLSDSDTSLYFEQISYRLRAEGLEIALIKQAYDQLVERHSVLRTSFTNDYGGVP
ncbi:condensation domain-containing protein, partial [uncultured Aquimarina sp.]|uniref:condensation domain-containing protein n=1 Tax=uncultured Aquimarina sp. TaxID=575652 RepID=UPI00262C7B98